MNGSLSLTRREEQSILIFADDSKIEVEICGVRGTPGHGIVSLRVTAPKKVKIYRTELYDKIVRERKGPPVPGTGRIVGGPGLGKNK